MLFRSQWAGVVSQTEAVTGIAFGLAPSAFAFGGWTGMIALLGVLLTLFFVVNNFVFGEVWRNIWGVTMLTMLQHWVPEVNVGNFVVYFLRVLPFFLLFYFAVNALIMNLEGRTQRRAGRGAPTSSKPAKERALR